MSCASRESGVRLSLTSVILPVHLEVHFCRTRNLAYASEKALRHALNLEERPEVALGVTLFQRAKKYAALS
jgi:hypothetical protein